MTDELPPVRHSPGFWDLRECRWVQRAPAEVDVPAPRAGRDADVRAADGVAGDILRGCASISAPTTPATS